MFVFKQFKQEYYTVRDMIHEVYGILNIREFEQIKIYLSSSCPYVKVKFFNFFPYLF